MSAPSEGDRSHTEALRGGENVCKSKKGNANKRTAEPLQEPGKATENGFKVVSANIFP